jgi:hypothetical protein
MAAPELLLQGRQPLHDLAGQGLEAIAQGPQHRIALIGVCEHRGAGNGLDAADAGRHALSATILNRPISEVLVTWVPPHSSIDTPGTSTTRC